MIFANKMRLFIFDSLGLKNCKSGVGARFLALGVIGQGVGATGGFFCVSLGKVGRGELRSEHMIALIITEKPQKG